MAMHWWQPSAALDATRIGGASYRNSEVNAVMAAIHPATYRVPISTASMALSSGIPGRTIRQILSDLDGFVMLLGRRPGGLFVCHYADEGDMYATTLEKHWRAERVRCGRRADFGGRLPRRQGYLFDPADDDIPDDDEEDDDD